MGRRGQQPLLPPRRRGRDDDLIGVLGESLRALTIEQIARIWWCSTSNPLVNALRRVRELERKGLLTTRELLAHPETPLAQPLAIWCPGRLPPSMPSIAHIGRTRWAGVQRLTTFVLASEALRRQATGQAVRELRASEATHDLHVAAVYLTMRRELPTRAASWRLEAGFGDGRGAPKVPDAMVCDGLRRTAIEVVGAYDVEKLEALHRACESRSVGYELW